MGFSVSGSFAALVVASFIAFGTFYGATSVSVERVTGAQQAAFEEDLDRRNTAVNITTAEWRTGVTEDYLVVEAENTGATTLSVNGTDVIVDNAYFRHADFDEEWVESSTNTETKLWQPGETYHVRLNRSLLETELSTFPPQRVQLVVESGVTDSSEITDQTV